MRTHFFFHGIFLLVESSGVSVVGNGSMAQYVYYLRTFHFVTPQLLTFCPTSVEMRVDKARFCKPPSATRSYARMFAKHTHRTSYIAHIRSAAMVLVNTITPFRMGIFLNEACIYVFRSWHPKVRIMQNTVASQHRYCAAFSNAFFCVFSRSHFGFQFFFTCVRACACRINGFEYVRVVRVHENRSAKNESCVRVRVRVQVVKNVCLFCAFAGLAYT